jgi:hypothetical protein
VSWIGFAAALAGVAFIAAHGGAGATFTGDALVFGSLLLSAAFVVVQPTMLAGRDPVALTAVQLAAAAAASAPVALVTDGVHGARPGTVPLLAMVGLAVGGTLLPFTLFAYGQARIPAEIAGAFLNLEPLVGAAAGALAFGDPFGVPQLTGALAILGGIALSTRVRGTADPTPEPAEARTPTHRPAPSPAPACGGRVHVSRRPLGPLRDMTLLAPRPDRTTAPRAFVTPVVRELPSAPAATGASLSPR